MWTFHDLKIAEQHQKDLQAEAENWRKAHQTNTYVPNRALKRKRRKQ